MNNYILEKVTITRHGASGFDDFLTEAGKASMQRLGRELKAAGFIDGQSTTVICSDKLRAIKSAQSLMMAADLDADEISHKELFSSDRQCNEERAIEVVKHYLYVSRNLVVVTHLELAAKLPYLFGLVLGTRSFPSREMNHGEGIAIDLRKSTYQRVGLSQRAVA